MTKEVIQLPFGIIQLFKMGDCSEISIQENFKHRPDKILASFGLSSFKNEMANNRASNLSPISTKIGAKYTILDSLFISYFRKV